MQPENLKHRIKDTLRVDQAVRIVWSCAPGLTIASCAITAVQGFLPLLSLYLMKLFVDAITAGLSSPDKGQAFKTIAFYIICMGAAALVTILFQSIGERVSELQGEVITDHVTDLLHAKSLEVDLEFYENPKYYDTFHRAQQEASSRISHIVTGLAQLGQTGISLLAMAGLLFTFHWIVAIILFIAALPGVLVRLKYSAKAYTWQRKRTELTRKTSYYHGMLTDGGYVKEVMLFNLGTLFRDRFRTFRKQLRLEKLKMSAQKLKADFLAQTGASLIVFGTYGYIAYQAILGAITLGGLVMYIQAFQRGLSALKGFLSGLAGIYEDNLFLANYTEFIHLEPKVVEPPDPKEIRRPVTTGIMFEHVSFAYPASDRSVLQDINLEIRPGEVIALVGENGCGKTTLIKLLCRLYDPHSGSISIDGTDIRHFKTKDLRAEISVIFQDYIRYSLSALENIWFGNIDISSDSERIVSAARDSGADQVIHRLPRGYQTVLGSLFGDGKQLSTGEWQKVGLARAFLKDAQIIVLDEPTSNLDALAEHEVFQAFRRIIQGRTAILISHRFSTVKIADRIFVLEKGRIVESGSHEELMQLEGMYGRMFKMQAKSYQ